MELLRRFVEGDTDAFETLFREHQPDVYRWLLRMVREPATAEDLVVETFWRIYRSRATFDWRRSFRAWARTIATNVGRDALRRRPLEVELTDGVAQVEPPDPAVSDDVRVKVRNAVAQLPVKHRVVVMLALVEGRPHGEIAEALGIAVGTVKSRLFYALRALRRKLEAMGVEP